MSDGKTDGFVPNTLRDQQSARDACTLAIYHAIAEQVENDTIRQAVQHAIQDETGTSPHQIESTDVGGVLIDALPTLGKSYTAARTAAGIYKHLSSTDSTINTPDDHSPPVGVTILTHRVENRQERKADAEEAIAEHLRENALDVRLLPSFTHDCSSFDDDVDERTKEKISAWYQRGLSPGILHKSPRIPVQLPCEGLSCEYMERRKAIREDEPEVVIGHPRHAYQEDLIRNRIVIFDEDPGDAFRTEFTSQGPGPNLHEVIHEYLSRIDHISATNIEDLIRLRTGGSETADAYVETLTAIKHDLYERVQERADTDDNEDEFQLTEITWIGSTLAKRLSEHGVDSVEQLADVEVGELTDITGIGPAIATQIIEHAHARVQDDPDGQVKYEFDQTAFDLSVHSLAFDHHGHALAPLATLAVLVRSSAADELVDRVDLGNGIHYVELPGRYEAVYDETHAAVYIRQSPDLSSARAVIGLDGTPIKRLWEGRLDLTFDRKRALVDADGCDRRQEYLSDVMEYRIVPMSTRSRPLSYESNVNLDTCRAFLDLVGDLTTTKPAVITTRTVKRQLTDHVLEQTDSQHPSSRTCPTPNCDPTLPEGAQFCPQCGSEITDAALADGGAITHNLEIRTNDGAPVIDHYGNIRSSNRFKEIDLGVVIGSQHPGDAEIKRLAGLQKDAAERETTSEGQPTRGMDLSYGIPGDPYLRYFRENEVVQAVFRFGRDADVSATVFVFTAAFPEWLQTVPGNPYIDDLIETRKTQEEDPETGGQFAVMRALTEFGEATVTDLHDHDNVNRSWPTIKYHLETFRDQGLVERREDKTWVDTGISEEVAELDQWAQRIDATGQVEQFEDLFGVNQSHQ